MVGGAAEPNADNDRKQVLCLEDVMIPNYGVGERDFPN